MTLRCPECNSEQLNEFLLKAHLIERHDRTVAEAEEAATRAMSNRICGAGEGGIFDMFRDAFSGKGGVR